jgi:hypothetical protein
MKKNDFNVALALSCLFMVSVSQAKCWKGIDCAEDLPSKESPAPSSTSTTEDWQIVDHYQVKGGLVKDPTTGLMWMRCSFGQTWDGSSCQGEVAPVLWKQAMTIPKNLDYAGYSDWRVPTRQELQSLVYCSNGQKKAEVAGWGCGGDYTRPTIVKAAFPNTPSSWFWSSSPNTSYSNAWWVVGFDGGGDGSVGEYGGDPVRLVRDGQ